MSDYSNFNTYPYLQRNYYVFVNGVEGAKAYQMVPNQTMLLMDNNSPMCFMKVSNNLGQSTLRYFKLVEVEEKDLAPSQENAKIDELSKKVEELYQLLRKDESNGQ